ncbi:post-transcriptional regulator [Paenibacillus sp. CC-CFT747]|nr:post-transcriptional regulator [Paenibacillus sp. CC-CFT747]
MEEDRVEPISEKAIEALCLSKAEEFVMLGYEQVTAHDIWNCIRARYEKTGEPPLHRLVNDILSLKITSYMNWLTMQAYKGAPF